MMIHDDLMYYALTKQQQIIEPYRPQNKDCEANGIIISHVEVFFFSALNQRKDDYDY